jgi:phosphoglycolate phosphatase-like HAD superfamily hydrolase
MNSPQLRGVIFDLDGTLVDSRLDFDAMRAEIGIPGRQPVLEYVEKLPPGDFKERCWSILERHEMEGARIATLMPGMATLLARLRRYS